MPTSPAKPWSPDSAITKTRLIRASLDRVWLALTDSQELSRWQEDACEMELRVGGRVSLFGGSIYGAIVELVPQGRLAYTWRTNGWPSDWADSMVTFTVEATPKGTRLRLVHQGLPTEQEFRDHADGWNRYFLGPMKRYLEQQS